MSDEPKWRVETMESNTDDTNNVYTVHGPNGEWFHTLDEKLSNRIAATLNAFERVKDELENLQDCPSCYGDKLEDCHMHIFYVRMQSLLDELNALEKME